MRNVWTYRTLKESLEKDGKDGLLYINVSAHSANIRRWVDELGWIVDDSVSFVAWRLIRREK